MESKTRNAIIISVSSDIGSAMGRRWKAKGWEVWGTYRTQSAATTALARDGIKMVHCDLSNTWSVRRACSELGRLPGRWDVLVMGAGSQEPVGAFLECDFNEWEESIKVNFNSQLRIVHELIPLRNAGVMPGPLVLFFAGGGTNNATLNYSAYTISKIGLIKMTELLDAEIPDTRFVIVGPGWVKTKIHEGTLKAGATRAGPNYQRTKEKLAGNDCTPMERVLDCCDWLVTAARSLVSGRNFSVVYDKWGDAGLDKLLAENPDMYKLRRFGNDWLVYK